ncbi:hypothetical protein QQF64_018347 [Cirrhinus molitorella]|uniref:Myb/SANT-like DNA-binding domain-containing protein n=1 Tax=Cirrhinus molitorella TaxID=172907 RepID=A0ABR3LCB3_9TELE
MASSWSVDEVQAFLSLIAEERIQRGLDGATRNENVFQEVAQLLAAHGYHRTYKQCRDKLKKLKSDYRSIKDQNSRSGSNRQTWKWYDQMDAIYVARPTSIGREGALDSATPLFESTIDDETLSAIDPLALSPCNDSPSQPELAAPTPSPSTSANSSATHLQMALEVARQAREQEAALRAEEHAQTAAFNQAFLNVMGLLVQAMSGRLE